METFNEELEGSLWVKRPKDQNYDIIQEFIQTGDIPMEVVKAQQAYVKRIKEVRASTNSENDPNWNPPAPTPKFYKEFRFMKDINFDRKAALNFDFEARQKLE